MPRDLTPPDPFNRLARDFQRLFPSRLPSLFDEEEPATLAAWEPAVDLKENDKEYVVTADIPGVRPEDVDIRLENGVLTLSGERHSEKRDEKEGYRRVERFEGQFYRAMALPDADTDKVDARVKEGVLTIRLPKTGKRQSKRIEVKGN